jgi:hypothetical protein
MSGGCTCSHACDDLQPVPEEESCVHCGDLLGADIGGGLFVHAHGLQRCQSDIVPYGHMGHPEMPCPPGNINPCMGYREDACSHFCGVA